MKSNAFGADSLMKRMFRKVDNVVWDLMTGKLGVRTKDGEIATIDGEGDAASISINPFEDFGVTVPAFAQSTAVADVKVGDLIYMNGETPGWIVEIKEKEGAVTSFRIMRAGGTVTTWKPPKVQMFGLDGGVLVVRSLVSMLPGGKDGLGNLQGSLLPLMLLGGGDMDMEKIMPLMLFSSSSGAGGNNMLSTMLMMKAMGGGGLGDLFGGSGGSKANPFRS